MPAAPAPDDLAYQDEILQGVSRTFALTIPQLPAALRTVIGNAYLLCRIADTIEDSDTLGVDEKKHFGEEFVRVVGGQSSPEIFAASLAPRLGGSTIPAERELVENTPRVIRVTHGFDPASRAALVRCVRIMSQGMEIFQEGQFAHGLRDVPHLDAYCYHVAGVVGEMLTELFCLYSPGAAKNREGLTRLAVSFGLGLQMTNILKDVWDDKARGVCWLPQDVFARHGFDLRELSTEHHGAAFAAGLDEMVDITLGHLHDALEYTLLIPRREIGIRKFCLWALGMAVLTVRKIRRNPGFTSGKQVKISRRSVKAVVALTQVIGWSNSLLRLVFRLAAPGKRRQP
ncbi:MAG: phytoene/squalene synthase family protein [FCB group bacterium]|jgi:farnesyl-diphosphate farnesyltransferase|nr:phytoene/squalene synthase family protein [FCB group bacterium]